MFILALGRRKRVGKDEFAKAFRERFLEQCIADLPSFAGSVDAITNAVRIVGFADELKIDAYNMFAWAGLREASYYEKPQNEYLRDVPLPGLPNHTPRTIWIAVGMFGRSIDPYYWTNKLFNQAVDQNVKVLIIKDLRFANEAVCARIFGLETRILEIENSRIPLPTDVADTQDLPPGWQDAVFHNEQDLDVWRHEAEKYADSLPHWRKVMLQELGYEV